ncbi:MAG: tetratricopeptide repeat protein [Rhodothalassiaceae bacterium]
MMRCLLFFLCVWAAIGAQADGYRTLNEPADAYAEELAKLEDRAKVQWSAAVDLAHLYYMHGQFDKALTLVDALLNKAPDRQNLQELRTRVYIGQIREAGLFGKMGIAKRMRAACEQDLARDPANATAMQCLAQFYLRAPGIAGGSDAKGMELVDKVAELDRAKYHFLYYVEAEEHDRSEAAGHIAKAVAVGQDPDLIGIATRFHLAGEEFDAAFGYLDQWRQAAPQDRELPYQFGRAAAMAGQRLDEGEAALLDFLKGFTCLRGRDYRAQAHFYLGRIFEQRGELELAREAYERARQLDSDLDGLGRALERLS